MCLYYFLLPVLTFTLIVEIEPASAWGGGDRVLLSDVRTLTLTNGRMTNARRSPAVKQLECVGGCGFMPDTVQCTNMGSDGSDAQWECKADMKNEYRFGTVEVNCEGYDYPNDPYILKGSCGLEYTIESSHGNTGGGYSGYSQYHGSDYGKKQKSGWGDLILLAIIALVIYAVYRSCVANVANTTHDTGSTGGDRPRPYPTAPPQGPPPSYDDTFGRGASCSNYGSSNYGNSNYGSGCNSNTRRPANNAGGGFWSGAGLGGLAGYFLGSRNRGYGGYASPRSRSWFGGNTSGWGNSGYGGSSWGGSGFSSGGSGTRTASGFGGTKRR